MAGVGESPWWAQDGLEAGPSGLQLDGHAVRALAGRQGTPLYAYSGRIVAAQLARLRAALGQVGLPYRIHYALKANRFGPLVALLRESGAVGIDAASPREVGLARAYGFARDEVSVTASMLSDRDLDAFAAAGVHLNLDSVSALRRYGARVPRDTAVGLRLDPGVRVGYGANPKVAYGDSKFGFRFAELDAAAGAAAAAGLRVDTLHVHLGWGLQAGAAEAVDTVFARLAAAASRLPTVTTVNVGGGLGARLQPDDVPLSLAAWSAALARHFGPLGLTVACEPGTWLVGNAGLLVVEVNSVVPKGDTTWLGVDAGHNLNVFAAHYGLPLTVLAVDTPTTPATGRYAIAGNINEANDVFGRDVALPAVTEGALLAFWPAGAYGTSMASDHCLRGGVNEVFV